MTGNPVIGMMATWVIDIAQNPHAALSAGSVATVVSTVITSALFGGSSPSPGCDKCGGTGGLGNWAWLMARPSIPYRRESQGVTVRPPTQVTQTGTERDWWKRGNDCIGPCRSPGTQGDFPNDHAGDTRLAFQIQDRGNGQRERQKAADKRDLDLCSYCRKPLNPNPQDGVCYVGHQVCFRGQPVYPGKYPDNLPDKKDSVWDLMFKGMRDWWNWQDK
jgi:hypothetical protein